MVARGESQEPIHQGRHWGVHRTDTPRRQMCRVRAVDAGSGRPPLPSLQITGPQRRAPVICSKGRDWGGGWVGWKQDTFRLAGRAAHALGCGPRLGVGR